MARADHSIHMAIDRGSRDLARRAAERRNRDRFFVSRENLLGCMARVEEVDHLHLIGSITSATTMNSTNIISAWTSRERGGARGAPRLS